ncbi:hypothetical protein L227DRAFT_503288 [Lentinus tigrinus ALCF2SS1-6]|uniref:DUF6699 domain-containing protein n=1 Tax=Lentinus tigrinus ALCF2SS1-6 TaxID=1328759 RepID=A0A5C2SE14_9APHY|nr:hypothetical protein L227DRAFT_503288 [Lentinus tigrinus ALCF2SS1-6]
MPSKHVRFVDMPTMRSASAPSSSTGPATLASPDLGTLPAQIHLHPLLVATDSDAPLDWDMSLPAESSRVRLANYPPQLIDTIVSQPATLPPRQSVAIICTYLPWTITVTPTPNATRTAPYVTVGDVLHTLYRRLRLGVTPAELGVLDAVVRDRVHDAYVARYRRVVDPGERDVEKGKRIKRVDFLREHRLFYGLTLIEGGLPALQLPHGAVWKLHTARS